MERPFIEVVRLFLASQGMPLPDVHGNEITVPDDFDGRSLLADDFVLNCLPGNLVGGVWTGPEAYNESGAAFFGAYDIEAVGAQLHDVGDTVFMTARNRFTLRSTGVSTAEIPAVEVYRSKSGQIGSLDIFYMDAIGIAALAK